MEIKKAELQRALEIVKPGLANKEIIEQATSFAFLGGRVITYNDEISISHPIPGLEIEGAVQAESLYKFLAKIKNEDVTLSIDKNEILVTSGRSKAGLALISEVRLPLEEVSEVGKWKDLPENFSKFMGFAMASCATSMSKPVLACVNVTKEGIIESSDNYRISRCDLKEEMPLPTFLIPATSVADVVKLNPTKIASGTGWVHFMTEEGTVISCRILEDAFPQYASYLTVKGSRFTFPNTIKEALDRAAVFARRDHILDEMVTISMEKNRLKIEASSESGWFEEDLNMKYDGKKVTFVITPYLLRGIIAENRDFILSDTNDRLKFAGEGWEYLTLLRK